MEVRLLSEMARVFSGNIPARYCLQESVYCLRGECVAFQLAYRNMQELASFRVKIESDLTFTSYCVRDVAVQTTDRAPEDADYLSHTPGLFPDYLEKLRPAQVINADERWKTLYFLCENAASGVHKVCITLLDFTTGAPLASALEMVYVSPVPLSEKKIHYTRWLHCDSLADYYDVPVFSQKHWDIIENYIRKAVQRGADTLLTPIHTPPLDTDIGEYRTTVQLVDIRVTGENAYSFSFDKLDRWIKMATRYGIKYFEMAHLFTQWGATSAPQFMAIRDGQMQRIFGWDTPADAPAYRQFLAQYISALAAHFRDLGITHSVRFHISDEPGEESLPSYRAAKEQVEKVLPEAVIMDALSEVRFYQEGVITHPVPAVNYIEPFVQAGVEDLWTYYCCSQCQDVPNCLIAMPGERIRALGVLLYKYQVKGFLQWGFNYYYTRNSRSTVSPYRTTDGEGIWPAGDPFIVYPGMDGQAEDSLRSIQMQKVLEDIRALKTAEEKVGREKVLSLITQGRSEQFSFTDYPRDEGYYLQLRRNLFELIS